MRKKHVAEDGGSSPFWLRLEAALAHANKTPQELADHLRVSVQSLSMIKTGRTKTMNFDNGARSAQFLGVSPLWLATGASPMVLDSNVVRLPEADAAAIHTDWMGDYLALSPGQRSVADVVIRSGIEAARQANAPDDAAARPSKRALGGSRQRS